ncbi:MAG TPA: class I SAM-dependent methyltransferase [bacterium]|nr:class I SAM-dependent methyltransferase [bacterium]
MNTDKLENAVKRPRVYEKGDSIMWTDEYVSKKLLEIHLDPDTDAASRRIESVEKTVEFISGFCHKPGMEILDLGCGPGLYAERLARHGHNVTGIDFSSNSISYAKNYAESENLRIDYVCGNYLELDYENRFDLVMLIYADFGVLLPDERSKVLDNVHKALKPGGIFIFDVINDKNADSKFAEYRTWSFEKSGFWKPEPYLELQSGIRYPEEKVFLKQHTVIDSNGQVRDYRFWVHHFSPDDMNRILSAANFTDISHFENILPATSLWDGENITFYKAVKN